MKHPKREYQLLGEMDRPSKNLNVSDDKSTVFIGRSFCASLALGHRLTGVDIMTSSITPVLRSKAELESLVKSSGGAVYQTEHAQKGIIVIAETSPFFYDEV